ncbi:MAG: sulfotransferase family protein [Planctomycetota bacterium]
MLGSGRSGTTMLGEILSHHPDVAYWAEPRPVWMYRHAYRPHHELTAEDLTPAIAHHIDRAFARFLARSGGRRFVEKTPSNCLRIPFIYALYPDCRIINIIRDGRNVVASILAIQANPPRPQRLMARILETPLWEWPAYVPLFLQTAWRTAVLRKRSTYWGVRPAGWQHWIGLPPHISAARQWKRVVEISIRDGRALPAENYLELRYERLIGQPSQVVREISAFAELPESGEMIDFAADLVDPSRPGKARSVLTDQQRREVVEEMNPLLFDLGYAE